MRLSAITLSMCLIGAVSVSSYPIGGSESESKPTNTNRKLLRSSNVDEDDGPEPLQDSPTQKQSNGATKAPKVGSNRGSPVSIDEVATPELVRQSAKYWKERNSKFPPKKPEAGGPKREARLLKVSDIYQSKKSQDSQTQKQSGGVINTPKKGLSRGSSVSTGSGGATSTGSHRAQESRGSALGQTQGAIPKSSSTNRRLLRSSNVDENDGPKPLQDPPTQKQSGGATTTPKNRLSRGSSVSAGPNGAIGTDAYQAQESRGSALGQTQGAVPKSSNTNRRLLRSSNVDENDGPKPLQDPPTQKQSGGATNAPKNRLSRGSSVSAGPNGAIGTGTHQAQESRGSTLGQTKGADSSTPSSSASKSTSPDLPGKPINPQEKKEPIPTPTPIVPISTISDEAPEVPTVREFLALASPGAPSRDRQEQAFRLFLHLNKPERLDENENLYTLTRIQRPRTKRIEQEKMMVYFESTYGIKQTTKDLRECERKISSFPGSNPSLASKYSKAKMSQTKAIEGEAPTDDDEGQKLIESCLAIRGQFLSVQTQSKRAWSDLTEEQRTFYGYIKSKIIHMTFKF
ncbi:hypothetical protein BASA83_004743 [Batrachochytrium salamandrivorans]|nr:hypothetical protein BASA83_004743 [Batrachochytrium salamandrivorans]